MLFVKQGDNAMSNFEQVPYDRELPEHSDHWRSSVERFSVLSPREIVAAAQLITHPGALRTDARSVVDLFEDDINGYVDSISGVDPARGKEVLDAFADSADPEMRQKAGGYSAFDLAKADHDAGLALYHRGMGDPDTRVREWSEDLLDSHIAESVEERDGEHFNRRGLRVLPLVNEAKLREWTGLNVQDVHDLYVTYAYAENGLYHDVALGHLALAKLAVVEPPATPDQG
ncbi:hypothetical protein [Streptomyces sp. MBT53]|uniref:hypothetical protein n=1 Tax=Streptomyces sp. MBT53 TaxID=1488384 RepID=UPI0019149A1E|nr:hypothetical protein [Streptomyces sp. MBT53]MBK6017010.1 hypothetical protein [Streptomyces sp. MBT53]